MSGDEMKQCIRKVDRVYLINYNRNDMEVANGYRVSKFGRKQVGY